MKVKSSDEIISDVLAEQYDLADIEEYRWKKNELRLDPIHKTASRYMTAFTLFGLILLSLWLVPMGMMAIAVHPDSNVDILTAQLVPIIMTALQILWGRHSKALIMDALVRIFSERTTIGVFAVISVLVYVSGLMVYIAACLAGAI